MVLDLRTSVSGFTGHGTVVLQSSGGTNYDHEARTATAIPAAQSSSQQFTQYYRRLPNLILLQALNAPNSLRHLGQESFDGRSHDVITFVMPDTQQVSLFVDAKSSLISKYEIIFVDSLFGEDVTEVLYGDYVAAGAHRVPRTFMIRQAGEVAAKLAVEVEINPPEAARVPPAMGEGYAKVAAPPASVPAAVEKLAEGVYSIQNVAGQNQNTLAVAFADHILAVEAPGSSAGSEAVIAKIKEVIPGKPIRYLAMTHHHGDHIGGVRGYIAEGAQIVTTRGNTELVRTMAQARQNDRLSKEPRAAEVTVVEKGRRVFSDSTQTVELIDIGPTPHAREMLIGVLAEARHVAQRRHGDRHRHDRAADDLHDRHRVRIGVLVVLREEALADAAGGDREAVGAERSIAVGRHLDAVDHHRVDLGLLDVVAALDLGAQRGQDALGVALDANVVGDEVDGAAVGRHGQRHGQRLTGELLLLEDLHAHAQHPVQRAVAAVGDPVARALAQEVAQHRLDRVEGLGLVDLAQRADDGLQPPRAVGLALVLAAVGVGDDADLHDGYSRLEAPGARFSPRAFCKKRAHRRSA